MQPVDIGVCASYAGRKHLIMVRSLSSEIIGKQLKVIEVSGQIFYLLMLFLFVWWDNLSFCLPGRIERD